MEEGQTTECSGEISEYGPKYCPDDDEEEWEYGFSTDEDEELVEGLNELALSEETGGGLAGNQTEDRLLTAIRDPKVLRRDGDAITVGFVTGPNLPKTQFVVKCVAGDGGCDAPAQGISEQGFLPFKPSEVEATVEGLDPDAPYSCFVEAFFKSTGKFSICKRADDRFSIRAKFTFDGFANADEFTAADREQLCINLNTLTPSDTCEVLKVETGSAEASAESIFSNTDDATEYQNTLAGANTDPDTQDSIVQGLSKVTGVVVSDIEPPPYAPDSGTARRLNRRRLFDIGSDVGL
eukprot:jgi/Picre1/31832/NNA_007181.t1